ncbi:MULTISPECIES: hypothetical protein [Aphanothece]|uniref:hypothetical protein n=1 Tax=Aphanothece TaxID=1121 RepID=UPI0039851822
MVRGPALGLLTALLMLAPGTPATAEPRGIDLRCREGSGPWKPCRMEVESVGERWSLIVGGQRIEFRQDGRGAFAMQRDHSNWIPVEASWSEDPALCWDGICAQGDLPLD